ncbi:microtubule-associated protein 65-9 [Actinidia rufa]|uniref:Microtubule-associated protein 65-9 n=1 Tax=Actinidia rufa TaxID=165716 RepID=A0A7J0DGU5_9ERIC|nr:microtubule-associated protein 65-9 [Actinidia rufa]
MVVSHPRQGAVREPQRFEARGAVRRTPLTTLRRPDPKAFIDWKRNLEAMQKRRNQFVEILEKISNELYIASEDIPSSIVVDESDLSTSKLEELHSELRDLQQDQSDRLNHVLDLLKTVNSLCKVLGNDFEKTVTKVILVWVDEMANKFDECTPPSAKQVASKAHCMVQKASEVALTLVQEAQIGGPCAAAHYAGNLGLQVFWSAMVRLWYVTNLFPMLHILAQMAIPTMAHWAEKYNKTIVEFCAKGYTSFRHCPEIPIDELVKAYKQIEAEKGAACAPCAADKETKMN